MKKILLISFLSLLILAPNLTVAAGLVPCGGESEPVCQLCHFFVMFKRWVDGLLFLIVPPLAVLMIAIGGFMYIVAYGGPAEMLEGKKGGPQLLSQAKSLFKGVIWGLLIIYGAWIIVNTFFMLIGIAEWTGLREGWWKIECEAPTQPQPTPTPLPPPEYICDMSSLPSTGCDQVEIAARCNPERTRCKKGTEILCQNVNGESKVYYCKPDGSWEITGLICTGLPAGIPDPIDNCISPHNCLADQRCPDSAIILCNFNGQTKRCSCGSSHNKWFCASITLKPCTNTITTVLARFVPEPINNCTPNDCLIQGSCDAGTSLSCNVSGKTITCTCLSHSWDCFE